MHKRDKNTHILVIRLSALGDVAMTIPVLRTLTATYPNLRLTVLTKKHCAPLFSGLERVSVLEADVKGQHKGIRGLWRLYKMLKAQLPDAVADLHAVLRSHVLKLYFTLDRIPFAQINKGRKEKRALTRTNNKVFRQLKSVHQRYADVFAQLGFPVNLSHAPLLQRQPLPEQQLLRIGKVPQRWIGIAPFATHAGKRYPLHLMRKVIAILERTQQYRILLFGGSRNEAKQLERLAKDFRYATNVAGKLTLSEELVLISNLDAMLSMDSSNAHMAANYNVPVVTLWGATHPYAGFYPFNQPIDNALLADREQYPLLPTSIYGNKVPKGYETVMESIAPQQVAAKLLAVLQAHS